MSRKQTNRSPIERVKESRSKYRKSDRAHKEELYGLIGEACSLTYEFDDDPKLFRRFKARSFFKKLSQRRGRKSNIDDVCTAVSVYIFSSPSDRRGKVAHKHERIIDYAGKQGMLGSSVAGFIKKTGGIGKTCKLATMTYPRQDTISFETTFTESPEDTNTEETEISGETEIEDVNDDQTSGSKAAGSPMEKGIGRLVKPKWPRTERSLNLQAVSDKQFSQATCIEPEQEIIIRAKRRPFNGAYIDLVVISVDVAIKAEG